MMNIFLDLEGTVIDEFKEFPTFLESNCEDIRRFLHPLKIAHTLRLHIFSFAIHSAQDEREFDTTIVHSLIEKLDLPLVHRVIRVPEMLAVSRLVNKMNFMDWNDFILLIGKERAFHDWCDINHQKELNLLIDDVVRNRTTHDNDKGTVIQTININTLFRSNHA